jgi:hypothetical protein
VVVTPPIELVGADETVPPTELLVVSRLLVVASIVVVVAPLVEVAPEVLVAPLVVVGLTVVVVAPVVVVGLTVVVVAPVLVVGFTVVVVAPVLLVGFTVVVVDSPVVVVPPDLVTEASYPTLTPANIITVTRSARPPFAFAPSSHGWPSILPSDLRLISARPLDRAHLQDKQAATEPVSVQVGTFQRLTGRLEAASALPRSDLQGEGELGMGRPPFCSGALGTSSAEDSRQGWPTQQSGVRDEKNVGAICGYTQFLCESHESGHQAPQPSSQPDRPDLGGSALNHSSTHPGSSGMTASPAAVRKAESSRHAARFKRSQ